MKTLPTLVANYYRKHNLLPDQTIDCMEYTLKSICNELSKFIIYLIIFAILGLIKIYIISYFVFVTLRIVAGGIHCKTYWRCLISSFVMISSTIALAHICIKSSILVYLSLLSIAFPLVLSPVTPSFRIITDKRRIWILRAIAVGLTLVWIGVAYYFQDDTVFSNTIYLSVIVTNYQLIIPWGISNINQLTRR